jgi:DNA polymerase I-like protein with 3'-5' exonuclease and polymerase domains
MVQSTAAEQLKLAMSRVWASGICSGDSCRFLFPVHDELCFSIDKDKAAEIIPKIHAMMVAPYANMKIPMNSSVAVGKTFATEVEIGTEPTSEKIQEAVEKLFKVG